MRIAPSQIESMAVFSGGHLYLMQLIGDNMYRLVDETYDPAPGVGETGSLGRCLTAPHGASPAAGLVRHLPGTCY